MMITRYIKMIAAFILLVSVSHVGLKAQTKKSALPQAFFIGEHQDEYDRIIDQYKEPFLNVCNQDVEKAFNHWIHLLTNLEAYSEKNGLDLKGVKIWVNVFWNADGQIKHFVFYPKPNSKNIDYEKMKSIVADFLSVYDTSKISSSTGYSHYGTATFPIYARLVDKN